MKDTRKELLLLNRSGKLILHVKKQADTKMLLIVSILYSVVEMLVRIHFYIIVMYLENKLSVRGKIF